MEGQRTDVKKMAALKEAGWGIGQIAHEMCMEPGSVEKEISRYMERRAAGGQGRQGSGEQEKADEAERGGRVVMVALSGKQMKEIYEKAAAIGAKEALKTFEAEQKKASRGRADRRLRNTKLLLRNYRMLKGHAEESVFGRTQMEESALDILESMMSIYDSEVIIESIKRSATRTAVIVSHIEAMFGLYEAYCDRSRNHDIERRRYETLWDMYMADHTLSAKEIAKKQHVSRDTVYADLRASTEKLTSLIFGVDGLNVR